MRKNEKKVENTASKHRHYDIPLRCADVVKQPILQTCEKMAQSGASAWYAIESRLKPRLHSSERHPHLSQIKHIDPTFRSEFPTFKTLM